MAGEVISIPCANAAIPYQDVWQSRAAATPAAHCHFKWIPFQARAVNAALSRPPPRMEPPATTPPTRQPRPPEAPARRRKPAIPPANQIIQQLGQQLLRAAPEESRSPATNPACRLAPASPRPQLSRHGRSGHATVHVYNILWPSNHGQQLLAYPAFPAIF